MRIPRRWDDRIRLCGADGLPNLLVHFTEIREVTTRGRMRQEVANFRFLHFGLIIHLLVMRIKPNCSKNVF